MALTGRVASYYAWLASGGYEAVAGLLLSRDVSQFNPKAPPPMTDAKERAIIASAYPEDAALSDVFEQIEGHAVTLSMVATVAWNGGNRELARELWSPKLPPQRHQEVRPCGLHHLQEPGQRGGLVACASPASELLLGPREDAQGNDLCAQDSLTGGSRLWKSAWVGRRGLWTSESRTTPLMSSRPITAFKGNGGFPPFVFWPLAVVAVVAVVFYSSPLFTVTALTLPREMG